MNKVLDYEHTLCYSNFTTLDDIPVVSIAPIGH